MRNILVTAISGNVSNGILKILSETTDNVYGCDIYDYPVGMDKVKAYWKSDLAVSDSYIKNLLNKCDEYNITHVIPVNEKEITVISKNRKYFEKKGIKLVIQPDDILDIFLDKYNTYCYLKEIDGIFVPKTFLKKEDIEDNKKYIVKLKHDCGSKLIKKVSSLSELQEIDFEKNECVIQEYLPDETNEYTVGVFSNGKKIDSIIYKRRLEHGYTSFVELIHDDKIRKMAETVAKNINLKGYINIQFRKFNDENYIFEINPRISGTVYFRHMLGFKDVLWWLELVDNSEMDYVYEDKYQTAIGMRELSEKYVVLN